MLKIAYIMVESPYIRKTFSKLKESFPINYLKLTMIYNWNIVRTETFKDIFTTFWNKQGKTESFVLELQNFITKEECDETPVRIFFGNGIKIEDWIRYNYRAYLLLNQFQTILNEEPKECKEQPFLRTNLSLCIATDEGPKITPINVEEMEEFIFRGLIDNDIDAIKSDNYKNFAKCSQDLFKVRLIKDLSGSFTRDNSKENNSEGPRFVRVRAIDLNNWKENINFFVQNGCFKKEFVKNDKFQLN